MEIIVFTIISASERLKIAAGPGRTPCETLENREGSLRLHRAEQGGIRECWLVQWPGMIPAGRVIDLPVIQLDVPPTALAAAGAGMKPEWELDGMNLTSDRGEQTDLSKTEPEKFAALQAKWDAWNATMMPPRWEDKRWDGDADRKKERKGEKGGKKKVPVE